MKNIMPKLKSKSLLCKYLTPDIFNLLKNKKTTNNFTLLQAINSGLVNEDSNIGVYAGDEESYSLFAPLLDPIIKEYHEFGSNDKHESNLNINELDISNLDPTGEFILSTRIRVARNLKNLPLGSAISQEQRLEVEKIVSNVLKNLQGDLKGTYYPLLGMDKETSRQLINDHFLFKSGDRFLNSAGLNRNWPEGRGIFHNYEKNFLVWINEEDQLRIISMQNGGNIGEVFNRLVKAIKSIEKHITFSYNDHLGYITSCPTNLGTALRASVHIKLPKLSKDMKLFEQIITKYHLQIRGLHGEHSKDQSGIYDISNRRRLGITDIQCVKDMYDGVSALIKKENSIL